MNRPVQPNQPGWYYRLSSFFRNKFGEPVYKIPIDAGFSCPNRDGTIGYSGCSYCYNPSFAPSSKSSSPIPTQLSITEQINRGKKKKSQAKHLAYFQSYTNTYAPLMYLKELYDEALSSPEVIGLSIATRSDCVTEKTLDMLESYTQHCHLWIEYGLQSAHDETLQQINRGHDTASFAHAVKMTRRRGIYTCAHIILGLPGETNTMILETIDFINQLGIDGIKFHHLQVIKNTTLADQYKQGKVTVYEKCEDYIPVLCDCLEKLAPHIVIHRLASQTTSAELLIAPHWPEGAGQIASAVETELRTRGAYQGCRYKI